MKTGAMNIALQSAVFSLPRESSENKVKKGRNSLTPHKEVFVSRTKFLASSPKASQGGSLAAFLASIQAILLFYETA